jgi:hypothetical protein
LTDRWIRSRSQPARQILADLNLVLSLVAFQRLEIGVDGKEINTVEPLGDHAGDGIPAATTNPDHTDFRSTIETAV